MDQQRATKQINIRLTPDQYDVLKNSGEVFELSPSAFLKKLAIETKPIKPPKQPKVSKLQWREFMQEYLHQGNNLNQFTKSMNLYLKYLDPEDRKAVQHNWAKLNHELKDLREQIWQSLVK